MAVVARVRVLGFPERVVRDGRGSARRGGARGRGGNRPYRAVIPLGRAVPGDRALFGRQGRAVLRRRGAGGRGAAPGQPGARAPRARRVQVGELRGSPAARGAAGGADRGVGGVGGRRPAGASAVEVLLVPVLVVLVEVAVRALRGPVILLLRERVGVLEHRRDLLPELGRVEIGVVADQLEHPVEEVEVVHRREVVALGAYDVEALREEPVEHRLLVRADRLVVEHHQAVQIDRHAARPPNGRILAARPGTGRAPPTGAGYGNPATV